VKVIIIAMRREKNRQNKEDRMGHLKNWANTCLLWFEHSTAIAIDSFMEGKIAGIHAAKR
jgi:hypothetical protein